MVKHLHWLIIFLALIFSPGLAQTNTDSIKLARTTFIKNQTVKADSLNDAALKLALPNASAADLNKAIENIMAGLHVYSKFRDTVGLRKTFDHLALVYHLQKKYTQAKWFFIQSNSLSRDKRDTINVVASLINLASVKDDIKDFSMAKRDLSEALFLAKTQPKIDQQIEVQKALAEYYSKQGDATAAATALNRINYLRDSVMKQIARRKAQSLAHPNTGEDTLQHINALPVNAERATHNAVVITIATLITAGLVGVCMLLYLLRKKRKQ
jgi:tetratricopeptide (TPR) repeat protein